VAASPLKTRKTKEDDGGTSPIAALIPALRHLDRLLEWAMQMVPLEPQASASAPFRGLFLTRGDIARLLTQEPAATPFGSIGKFVDDSGELTSGNSPLTWLTREFGLCSFDGDLVLLALAPEIDLKYERVFGYLQDDVTRKRPTVELALNLLCISTDEKLQRRSHLCASGRLVSQGLLHVIPDTNQADPPFLAHYLKLDDQITRLLLGLRSSLDTRLAPFCRILEPGGCLEELQLSQVLKRGLPSMVRHAWGGDESLRFYVCDPLVTLRQEAAKALAALVGAQPLALDLTRLLSAGENFEQILRVFFREARFRDAVPYLDGLDILRANEHSLQLQSLMLTAKEEPGITILGGSQQWVSSPHGPTGVIEVPLGNADFAARRAHWQACLAALDVPVDHDDLRAVADRFRLDSAQIAEASATARNFAALRAAAAGSEEQTNSAPSLIDLFAAARAQSGHDLGVLARKIEPRYTWDDIVLPSNTLAQLHEICSRVAHRHMVFDEWGFDRKLSHGKGVNALFAGPSGCGKTMAAEIIANELQLDLCKIDLAGVVSKYIGETEKNLDRIFKAAENANAILFFDEADALFGKRSEVRDSHDRYANIEVSYLLQKMEEYEGIAILASNLRQHMDESFLRRLAFTVHFPFPDEADRKRIWKGIWPSEIPLASDLNLADHAKRFKLSGGNIKNVALAAAFLAANDGGVLTMAHLFHATGREYEKMGKALSAAELYGESIEKSTPTNGARAH
jgi:hypothetical protein